MTQTTHEPGTPKSEIERDFAELIHVRDEIRLKLHLAGMDLKDAWHKLEKKLELLEEKLGYEGDHVAKATKELTDELKQAFRDFKQRLL